jgi:hypothetical protein
MLTAFPKLPVGSRCRNTSEVAGNVDSFPKVPADVETHQKWQVILTAFPKLPAGSRCRNTSEVAGNVDSFPKAPSRQQMQEHIEVEGKLCFVTSFVPFF